MVVFGEPVAVHNPLAASATVSNAAVAPLVLAAEP